MSEAFVDKKCPDCNGEGCEKCGGTGVVGSYVEVPDAPKYEPTQFGILLREVRSQLQLSIKDVSKFLSCPPSHISGIETGREEPTELEKNILQEWFSIPTLDRENYFRHYFILAQFPAKKIIPYGQIIDFLNEYGRTYIKHVDSDDITGEFKTEVILPRCYLPEDIYSKIAEFFYKNGCIKIQFYALSYLGVPGSSNQIVDFI